MHKIRDAFCSFCGTAHRATGYPRTCPNPECAVTIWSNPIPVVVALVPLMHAGKRGLLVVKRGIEPAKGKLALVGGFLEDHERWQEGAAREVREETGVLIEPTKLEPFHYVSTEPKPNRVLLFSIAAPVVGALPPHVPNAETAERGAIFGLEGLEREFGFPLHLEAARRYLEREGLTGPHEYTAL
ncbi:MAG: NUDIX domain-containing protein [Polyangiales bacterium]